MRKVILSSVAVTALTAGMAYAQSDAEISDVITVRSTLLETPIDSLVGFGEVIEGVDIENGLVGNIADTLTHEPGVSSTYFGPAASRPVIRGLGADRVRILTNGVGLIDASTSSPDHAVASEALEADRIEILRGPAAIAYGGAAIGGVVNVIDGRIPEERAEDGLEGRFYGGLTSVDEGETASGRIRFNAGEFVVQLEMLTRTAQDFDIPGFAESERYRILEEMEEEEHDDDHDDDHDHEEEEAFGTVENTGLDFSTGSVGVSWVGDRGFIGVAYKSTDALYGIPGHHHHHEEEHDDDHDDDDHDDDHDDDDHDHEDEHEHGEEEEENVRIDLVQIRYDLRGELRDIGEHIDRVRFSFGVADYKHVELEGDEVGTLYENEGWEGRVETRFNPVEFSGGEWEGAIGLQAFSRDFVASGEEAFVPPSLTEDFGLFTTQRWDAGNWGLEGGLRLETRDISTATASRDFDTLSVSGSVFWRAPNDTFMAVTLSSSERAPTDIELFADGEHVATQTFEIGDADLDVERATSIEFTARTSFGDWDLEGAVFHADYDGFIGGFRTGAEMDGFDVVEFRQEDVTLSGLEGRIEGPLGTLGAWDLTGELSGEYVSSDIDGGGNLPQLPPLSVTTHISAEQGPHSVHAEMIWAADQDDVGVNELETDGYTLFNARYVVEPFEQHDLRFIFEGRNLGDEEARLHTSFLKDTVPLPGRNFRVAMVMDF